MSLPCISTVQFKSSKDQGRVGSMTVPQNILLELSTEPPQPSVAVNLRPGRHCCPHLLLPITGLPLFLSPATREQGFPLGREHKWSTVGQCFCEAESQLFSVPGPPGKVYKGHSFILSNLAPLHMNQACCHVSPPLSSSTSLI